MKHAHVEETSSPALGKSRWAMSCPTCGIVQSEGGDTTAAYDRARENARDHDSFVHGIDPKADAEFNKIVRELRRQVVTIEPGWMP